MSTVIYKKVHESFNMFFVPNIEKQVISLYADLCVYIIHIFMCVYILYIHIFICTDTYKSTTGLCIYVQKKPHRQIYFS